MAGSKEWREEAACKGFDYAKYPDVFFADDSSVMPIAQAFELFESLGIAESVGLRPDKNGRVHQKAVAVSLCGKCKVRESCLEDSLAHESSSSKVSRQGIRAGLDGGERSRLIRREASRRRREDVKSKEAGPA